MNNESLNPDDYDELLMQYKVLNIELNEVKQNLYETTRKLKVHEALVTEYQGEVEVLQRQKETRNEKLETKIISLEEIIASLRSNHLENVSYLESELEKKEKENEELKNQIELLEKKNSIENISSVSVDSSEIINLTNENELLRQRVEEMEDALKSQQTRHTELEETLQQYKEEISQLKESLNLKKEELSENAILIDKLNDELLCANQELDNYKQKPLEANSKGNSLFAEVDDRRVHLQETIDNMKSTYTRLKQDHYQDVKLISNLRRENARIRELWKKDLEEVQDDKYWVNDTLQRHVKRLEEIIQDQKKQLEEESNKPQKKLGSEYEFYQQMIDDKKKEVEEWKQRYSDVSITSHTLSRDLATSNKKLRFLRLELQEKLDEIEEAKSKSEKDKVEVSCHRCKADRRDNRTTRTVEIEGNQKAVSILERKTMKSCLKQKEPMPDNDVTLDVTCTEKDIKKEGDYNVFKTNSKIKMEIHTSPVKMEDTKENLESILEDLTLSVDKENMDFNIDSSIVQDKKGVTFSENTVDSAGNAIKRRTTRIFEVRKKM